MDEKEVIINFQDLSRLSLMFPNVKKMFTITDLQESEKKIPNDDILKVESSRLDIAFKKLCTNLHVDPKNFKSRVHNNENYSFRLDTCHYLLKILQENTSYNKLLKNGITSVFSIEEQERIKDVQNFINYCINDTNDYNNAMSVFAAKFELNDLRDNPIRRMANILFQANGLSFKMKKNMYESFISEVDEVAFSYLSDLAINESELKNYDEYDLLDNRVFIPLTDAKKMLNKKTTNNISISYYAKLIQRTFPNVTVDLNETQGKDRRKEYEKLVVKKYKAQLIKEIKLAIAEVTNPNSDKSSKFLRIDSY